MSDSSKPRIGLLPLNGLPRAAQIMARGLRDGREVGDWKRPPMTRAHFVDARLRHIIDLDTGNTDEDHEGAILANTLIIAWYDDQKAKPESDDLELFGEQE